MGILGHRDRRCDAPRKPPKTPVLQAAETLEFLMPARAGEAAERPSRPRPLQPYPEPPQGSLKPSQRDRYGRELAASIRDGTAPLLITADEVCHALDVKRVPADLDCVTLVPGGKHQGPDLYRSADVRSRL
jgi:hypothetical protein